MIERCLTNRASAAGARFAGAPRARSFYATRQAHKRNSSLLGRARQLQALVMRWSALGADPVTEVLAAAMRLGAAWPRGSRRVRWSWRSALDLWRIPPKYGRMFADRRITGCA